MAATVFSVSVEGRTPASVSSSDSFSKGGNAFLSNFPVAWTIGMLKNEEKKTKLEKKRGKEKKNFENFYIIIIIINNNNINLIINNNKNNPIIIIVIYNISSRSS